jgi:hypothetical protein
VYNLLLTTYVWACVAWQVLNAQASHSITWLDDLFDAA